MQTSVPEAPAHLYRRLTGFSASGGRRAGVTRRLDGATFSGWRATRQRRVHVGAAAPKHSVSAGGGKVRSCKHVNDWVKYLLLYFLQFLLLNFGTRILSDELQQWFSWWTWPDLPAWGDIVLCMYIYIFLAWGIFYNVTSCLGKSANWKLVLIK